MERDEALRVLGLPADASADQILRRQRERAAELERQLLLAPTPGLKARHRAALGELEKVIAAIGGEGVGRETPESSPMHPDAAMPNAAKAGPGNAWWLMASIAGAAVIAAAIWAGRAEDGAGRKPASALSQPTAEPGQESSLRQRLLASRATWDQARAEIRLATRRLAELEGEIRQGRARDGAKAAELRALRDGQQSYVDEIGRVMARRGADGLLAEAGNLIASGKSAEATRVLEELDEALGDLPGAIKRAKLEFLAVEGEVDIRTHPEATWRLTDGFGRVRTGKGPARLAKIGAGSGNVSLSRAGWPDRTIDLAVKGGRTLVVDGSYAAHALSVTSEPAGADVILADGSSAGITPLTLRDLPPGEWRMTLRLAGHEPGEISCRIPSESGSVHVVLPKRWVRAVATPALVAATQGPRVTKAPSPTGSGASQDIPEAHARRAEEAAREAERSATVANFSADKARRWEKMAEASMSRMDSSSRLSVNAALQDIVRAADQAEGASALAQFAADEALRQAQTARHEASQAKGNRSTAGARDPAGRAALAAEAAVRASHEAELHADQAVRNESEAAVAGRAFEER